MKVACDNRHGHRDATMILAFWHGLRAPEICALRWEQAELAHVSLIRNGMPCVHPPTARRGLCKA
jgi:integrase